MECGQSFVGQWKSLFINKEGQANTVRKQWHQCTLRLNSATQRPQANFAAAAVRYTSAHASPRLHPHPHFIIHTSLPPAPSPMSMNMSLPSNFHIHRPSVSSK